MKKVGRSRIPLQERKEKRKNERKKLNYPRISLKSIFYTTRIYHKAVGPKSYFFIFYRIYNSVAPSVIAVIGGVAITQVAEAIISHDFGPFAITVAILFGIQLVDLVLGTINYYISITTDQDVIIYVTEQVAMKYVQIPLATRESREFADKFDRVKDFGSSIPYVSHNIVGVFTSVVSLISVVIATLTISPLITLIVVVAAIPSSVISLRLAATKRRNWREYTRDRRISWAILNKITNSNNALEIEMNGLSKHLIKLMVKARRRSQEQDIIENRRFLWPRFGADSLELLATYIVLIFVAIGIVAGRLAIGQFLSVRNLLQQLTSNIDQLFNHFSSVSEDLVNATDFMEFMATPAQPSGDIMVTETPKIEFKNVSFSYPNNKTKALSNVSFVINPGDSLAIVGENGAGKTTIIKLLIGAYEPTDGTILVNDIPLEDINRESYLAQIGALFQDFSRYEFATLGENVWFGDVRKKYDPKAITDSLSDTGLEGLIEKYEKGLDQVLSKDFEEKSTVDLSGGQWQRLAVSRAFFRSPNVLLLDEPTSAIDAKSEYEIFQNIIHKQRGKSTIIISHRFSTVRKAKSIIVLNKGKIIEAGTHEELMANNKVYRKLFDMQAEGYN